MAANAQIILSLQTQAAPQLAQLAGGTKALTVAQLAQITAAQRLEQQTQKTALASQRLQTEEQKTATQVANAAAAEDRAALAALRLQQAQDKAKGSTSAFGQALNDLKTIALAAGVAFGVQQIVQYGKGALDAANSLDKTESTVRALSGSQARYNEVLAVARAGQQAYGGSLEENIGGLGTLVNLSNRAGVSLGTLDNISRRLAVVDPVQGIEGANIALKEFLSGNGAEAALSLARRFELPKQALADLGREGTTAQERLDGLNKLLNEQGITTQVLTDRTKTQAAIYDQLSAAALNARDAIGALLAAQGGGAAKDLTGGITGITQLITAYNNLAASGKNVATYIGPLVNPLGNVNEQILKYSTMALRYAGALADAAPAATQLAAVTTRLKDDTDAATGVIQAATLNMDDERRAAYDLAHGLQDKANADKLASVQAQTHAIAEKQVDDAARRAADAMIANGNAGAQAAALLAKSSSLIDRRTAAYYDLEKAALAAQAAENAASVAKTVATNRATGRSSGREGGSDFAADTAASVAATRAQTAEQEKHLDAEIALAAAKKDTGRQIDLLRQKEQLFGKDADDRTTIEAQIIGLQTKGDSAHTSALTKQLGLQESIYDSINKQKDAMLDIEELTIRDRQQDRADAQKIAQAQRILSDPRKARLQDAARDALALIDVQDRKRAQELIEKQATAGGAIVNGRVLQSRPGSGAPVGPGAIGAIPPAPGSVAQAGGAASVTLRLVDSAGRLLADLVGPFIFADATVGLARSRAGGGGKA